VKDNVTIGVVNVSPNSDLKVGEYFDVSVCCVRVCIDCIIRAAQDTPVGMTIDPSNAPQARRRILDV
jgi:hypothetical protein